MADGYGRQFAALDGDGHRVCCGSGHFTGPLWVAIPRASIARLLRGDDKGPVKTGPDVRRSWCAILGLNQFNWFASVGVVTWPNGLITCNHVGQYSGIIRKVAPS